MVFDEAMENQFPLHKGLPVQVEGFTELTPRAMWSSYRAESSFSLAASQFTSNDEGHLDKGLQR